MNWYYLCGLVSCFRDWSDLFIFVFVYEQDVVVHKTSIKFMKENNEKILGKGFGSMFEGGGNSFIHKGVNGRWADEISDEESAAYIQHGKDLLGDDVMHWVLTGEGL